MAEWSYGYDSAKRLKWAARRVNGALEHSYTYAYDGAGNRTRQTVDGATTAYAYNALDQLIAEGSTRSYLYDTYGNLEYEKQDGTVQRRYVWDGENHLVKAELSEGGPTQTVTFGYDDQGTRVKRQQGTAVTRYQTDTLNPTGYSQPLAELDESGTVAGREYVYGAELLAQVDSAAADPAFIHGDNLGSTRLLTAGGGGAKLNSNYDYAPFGEPLGGDSSLTSYRFTGQFRDPALGLQYHRARWLNPQRAAWLSVDPAFDYPNNFGSVYGYAGNNPVSHLDPNGSMGLVETAAVTGIVSGLAMGLGFQLFADRLGGETLWQKSYRSLNYALTFMAIGFISSIVMSAYPTFGIPGVIKGLAEVAIYLAMAGSNANSDEIILKYVKGFILGACTGWVGKLLGPIASIFDDLVLVNTLWPMFVFGIIGIIAQIIELGIRIYILNENVSLEEVKLKIIWAGISGAILGLIWPQPPDSGFKLSDAEKLQKSITSSSKAVLSTIMSKIIVGIWNWIKEQQHGR